MRKSFHVNVCLRKLAIAKLVKADILGEKLKTMYTFDKPFAPTWKDLLDDRPVKCIRRELGKDWKLEVGSIPSEARYQTFFELLLTIFEIFRFLKVDLTKIE